MHAWAYPLAAGVPSAAWEALDEHLAFIALPSALQVTRALAPRNAKPTVHRPQPRGRAARRAGVVAAAAPPAAEVTVREEKLEGSATRLHITVPAPMCQAAYKKIMADLRKGTTVDGFRKGKVQGVHPRPLRLVNSCPWPCQLRRHVSQPAGCTLAAT